MAIDRAMEHRSFQAAAAVLVLALGWAVLLRTPTSTTGESARSGKQQQGACTEGVPVSGHHPPLPPAACRCRCYFPSSAF